MLPSDENSLSVAAEVGGGVRNFFVSLESATFAGRSFDTCSMLTVEVLNLINP